MAAASLAAARFAGEASPAPAAAGTGPWGARSAGRVVAMRRQCARGAVVRCAGRSFGGGASCGNGNGEWAAEEEEGARFVGWFREAWPYVRGHRGSTFVVVVSGEVVAGPHLDGILQGHWNRLGEGAIREID